MPLSPFEQREKRKRAVVQVECRKIASDGDGKRSGPNAGIDVGTRPALSNPAGCGDPAQKLRTRQECGL